LELISSAKDGSGNIADIAFKPSARKQPL
jgi:hypothetical protein